MEMETKKKIKARSKKGSALIFATIVLFVILTIVATLSSVTMLETKMSQKTKSSIGAFFQADSGIEWAMNVLATKAGTTIIRDAFSGAGSLDSASGKIDCPTETGFSCRVYLLDKNGNVINSDNANGITFDSNISEVKSIRAVGVKDGDTARAIEASVAQSTGGPGSWSCELVSASNNGTAQVSCPSTKTLITGGCSMLELAIGQLFDNRPKNNGWYCYNNLNWNTTAYAWCCE